MSGRNDDTLWHTAGPVVKGAVTATLGTLPEQQSFSVMLLLTALSYGKTWQQPLDSDPTVSLRSKQTNYSSVGLYSSATAAASPAPSESTKTTKCAVASQPRALKWLMRFKLIAPWYLQSDETQVFKCLTPATGAPLHTQHIWSSALVIAGEIITYFWTRYLRRFCSHIQ